MNLDGAREQGVVVATGATDAVEQPVDLVDQGLEQGPGVGFDARQQCAQRRGRRQALFNRELRDQPLALGAIGGQLAGLPLDGSAQLEHMGGVALEKAALLLFEEVQEPTIVGQFRPQAVGNLFPGGVHGFGRLAAEVTRGAS